ncbi:ABC-F family ATP-binding cassette domain-containing protein [Sporosarcina trichiuri]|uniref:ABC-F family ATP-binding cassette domain-containing protein n=1 Tax=Sporosarcina trichiuri TaxID=3056445 RepID=UPI0025B46596|nr:ABC-F family ATP-binding cassette domain-containing protein [Sporosarcina sp. 0.2-SM1T-5]WJY27191.1 ABC-F family ATP-binding cassette domain-containing protein [Sporosarcina sp. 0.2-SM1T-5]
MIILQVNGVTKSFSGTDIMKNVKLEVQHRDRVALVGRNGAGKSTLLKIIAGEIAADSGDVIIPKGVRVGYLEQHSGLETELSIWDEMMTVFEPLHVMERRLRELEMQMSDPAVYGDPAANERVMAEYDSLQIEFKDQGGYQYESDARSVLHGMRFFPDDYGKPVHLLSGGQKTRLALAKMLLSKPDLLILDEPTNHLDIETLSWLETYLKSYEGALLIVSHDRYFLDQVVTIVYEVSHRKVARFTGNYSAYLDEKAKNYEKDRKQYEKESSEKAKLEEFIQKNIARASTSKMAKSRRKQLERTEWMEAPDSDEKSASFSFTIDRPSGNDVLAVKDASIGYNGVPVSSGIDMRVYKQDRIAILGPNGVGKSTLLKTIVRLQDLLGGSIEYGTNVQFGYYDQNQATLVGSGTVLQEIWDDWPLMNEKDIRTLLGRFLFSGDDVSKPVQSLSGGEKARLSLAKLMLEKSNTLVLDEPTNHLDLDSKEVLENALDDFPGTILFVSHDRYFINRIATKVFDLSAVGAVEYLGDYDYFIEKKTEQEELLAESLASLQPEKTLETKPQEIDKERQKQERRLKRASEQAEAKMAELDGQIAELQKELENPAYADDHVKLMDIQASIDNLQTEHDEQAETWLELQEQLETV